MDESNYPTNVKKGFLSGETRHLLMLSVLPLVDGFFLVFLTHMENDLGKSVVFGLTAFSGAGCFAAATQMTGAPTQRLRKVLAVYATVAVGAFVVSTTQPIFDSLLPENVTLFTAMFLIGLGFQLSGVKALQTLAKWIGFESVLKFMFLASVFHGLTNGVDFRFSVNAIQLVAITVAVISGFLLTTLGMLFGVVTRKTGNQRPLNLGAGFSLFLMGLTVLGVEIHSATVIAPLALGCLWLISNTIKQLVRLHFSPLPRAE